VHYRVSNQGAGITYPGSWTDSVWLTLGKDRPNAARGDILVGSVGTAARSTSASTTTTRADHHPAAS